MTVLGQQRVDLTLASAGAADQPLASRPRLPAALGEPDVTHRGVVLLASPVESRRTSGRAVVVRETEGIVRWRVTSPLSRRCRRPSGYPSVGAGMEQDLRRPAERCVA